MKQLAIDTSTEYLSLAVLDGDKIIGRFHRKIGRNHSSLLIPYIDKLLKKARLKLKDIDCYSIGIGPGSFTGLRIGVTTVKGLAYCLKKPIAAIPTLDAIAGNINKYRGIICPIIDARKNKFYACLYDSGADGIKRVSGYLLLPLDELMKLVDRYDKIFFLGDAAHLIGRSSGKMDKWHPRAEVIGRIALGYIKRKEFTGPEDLEPLYLYSKECDIKGT